MFQHAERNVLIAKELLNVHGSPPSGNGEAPHSDSSARGPLESRFARRISTLHLS
jgi:hypothetical protein